MTAGAAVAGPSRLAWALGGAGLLPFVAGAAGLFAGWPAATGAVAAYGATIVSFLGGIHWGLAFREPAGPPSASLVWGVLPSLAAWGAWMLPPPMALAGLAASLVACYAVDRRAYPRFGLAAWLPLRRTLTVVATLCCAAGAARLAA